MLSVCLGLSSGLVFGGIGWVGGRWVVVSLEF